MGIPKKTIVDCMKRERLQAIPQRNKRRPQHQVPLWAWMRGAHLSSNPSKIEKVLANECHWPWYTLSASGYVFMERITAKRSLPWVQRNWLYDYITRRYQGHYKNRYHCVTDDFQMPEERKAWAMHSQREVEKLLDECLEKAGGERSAIPLRLILSPELSCLINLKFMEYFK